MMPDRKIRLVESPEAGTLDALSDDDLFVLVQADRKDAFEHLIRRHQRLVLGLAIRYLGDPATGRDVSQDVFLALWSERHRYQPRGRFVSYLVSMTTNRCNYVSRQRSSNQRKVTNLSREPDAESKDMPVDELLVREKAKRVRSLLTSLPEKPRQVLILRYTHDMSINEISRATGMPTGTVKSHISRGVNRLHELWTGGGA